MECTTIKPGYRLSITSWENDADDYGTKVLEGLSKEKVQLYLDLCTLFKANRYSGDLVCFGNMYEPSDEELQGAASAVKAIVDAYPEVLTLEEYIQVSEEPCDYMSQILGYSEVYAYRVFDSFKVELVPTEIVLQDVTAEFHKF